MKTILNTIKYVFYVMFLLSMASACLCNNSDNSADDISYLIKNIATYKNPINNFSLESNETIAKVELSPYNTLMSLEKKVSANTAQIGDIIKYTLILTNISELNITNLYLTDLFPKGMIYQSGTAKINGETTDDPIPTENKTWSLYLKKDLFKPKETIVISYVAKVGAGVKNGMASNTAIAYGNTTTPKNFHMGNSAVSNIASADIKIGMDAFDEHAILLGKVFADSNKNGVQDSGELGIPNVRLILETGVSVYTDIQGKYSIYGLSPLTHVLKVDRTSLPNNSSIIINSPKQAGKSDSFFVDLKKSSLENISVAINITDKAGYDEINTRIKGLEASNPLLNAIKETLRINQINTDTETTKGKEAKGTVNPIETTADSIDEYPESDETADNTISPETPAQTDTPQLKGLPDDVIEQINNNKINIALGFVNLKDQDILLHTNQNIIVKGIMGSLFTLYINGETIASNKVGVKYQDTGKIIEVWQYIGINLIGGENEIKLEATDGTGSESSRESMTIHVFAPDKIDSLENNILSKLEAGGRSVGQIAVIPQDKYKHTIGSRIPITIYSELENNILNMDMDKKEPGIQNFIEEGEFLINIAAPKNPGTYTLRIVADSSIPSEIKLVYDPEQKPFSLVGIAEGKIGFSSKKNYFSNNDNTFNIFSDSLLHSQNGDLSAGARLAFYMTGSINKETNLTLAYDSAKEHDQMLFRDMQPEDYYPIYGDDSVREYDAQSTSGYYMRLEQKQSYLLLGDYQTLKQNSDFRSLSAYNRSLTGIKAHYENKGNLFLDTFASYGATTQIVDEMQGNGTSGPYQLSQSPIEENSDKVEIITKDKNNNSSILSQVTLTRYYDYTINYDTGELITKQPVSAYDSDLNPVYIKISYEVNSNGKKYWTYGFMGTYYITKELFVSGIYVDEDNSEDAYNLSGITVNWKPSQNISVTAEAAATDKDTKGSGKAYRLDAEYKDKNIETKAKFIKTSEDFYNPNASVSEDKTEAEAKIKVKINEKMSAAAEYNYSKDNSEDTTRNSYQAYIEQRLSKTFMLTYGIRHVKDNKNISDSTDPIDFTSFRVRLTKTFNDSKLSPVFLEYEQDFSDPSKNVLAAGASYQMTPKAKIYARYEFISKLAGRYESDDNKKTPKSIIGIETNAGKLGKLYSEYRTTTTGIDYNNSDLEAAIGLRNTVELNKSTSIGFSFEKIIPIKNNSDSANESLAVTGSVDYSPSKKLLSSAKLEYRYGSDSRHWLASMGAAYKFNDSLTGIIKGILDETKYSKEDENELKARAILGLAYRDTKTDRFDSLLKYEFRRELENKNEIEDCSDRNIHIISLAANYRPVKSFRTSFYLAYKQVTGTDFGENAASKGLLWGLGLSKDLNQKWTIGANYRDMSINGAGRKNGYGIDIGYNLFTNARIVVGYNLAGFYDIDFSEDYYTDKGLYIDFALKFQ